MEIHTHTHIYDMIYIAKSTIHRPYITYVLIYICVIPIKSYMCVSIRKKTTDIRGRANVVDFDFATSCHFMPLQVAYAVCHFKWRMPLQVAC